MLQEYTLEELYYEYRDRVERDAAAEEATEEAADTIDQKKLDETLDWAQKEEEAELATLAEKAKQASDSDWMTKHLQEAKQEFGDDFGDDIAEDFI